MEVTPDGDGMAGRCTLGIAHEEGLIKDESPKAPEPETLDKGVAALVAAFPKGDVARYFWTLLWQDPDTWGGLSDLPESRPVAPTP